jgi:DNA-binding IscR family transcriptional regulator
MLAAFGDVIRSGTRPLIRLGGGYVLARDPKHVTVLEVVEGVGGPLVGLAPPLGKEGEAIDRRLQAACDEAVGPVRERLARVTLADLARGK